MSIDKEAIEALIAIGEAATVRTLKNIDRDENPFLVIRSDYKVEDLEKYLPNPTRKRGSFVLEDTSSFIAYVKRHKNDDTGLYATFKEAGGLRIPSFVAVFDEHSKSSKQANWRQHKATYDCQLSEEWKIWIRSNKSQVDQTTFAQFIEDNLPDIIRPDGASLMEVAKTLEAKKDVSFKSGIRLENGDVQFQYSEDTTGRAGNGTMEIPSEFVIGIPIVFNGPVVEIKARLRYRIPNGALTFRYDLVRPHKAIEEAFMGTWGKIEVDTELMVLHGKG